MAKQTLQTVITLSGQVDNSFGVLGQRIMALGSQIDGLSQKVIEFGKESIEQYVSYDDVMREVQALGEYDGKTIQTLNEYNRSIAQTSKYTMQQAGQAEVMMAQLGLNMEQTRTLMPTVMNLATAANIELADSLDYLYYTLNALGEPMSYADTLADQMSKTAAISAADIDTLGQSMQRLGSGAKFFAGGSEEILAILGGISQFGSDMQGRDAGTQLRNFMLTLLAPTKSKDELISSLRVTEEEWAEFESYMDDAGINVTDTAAAMNELGLSVYDSATGELKPAIQIIGELDAALSTLSEAEKNKMLGNLFGKRTTTTALNLIESLDTIIQYQEEIEKGSEGYTQSMADTMEGGLGGALREFNAALDAFKVTVGERLAPQIENITDSLTGFINSLTNMDDDKLDALISGATGIAALGPGLLLAGGAFRLIGFAMTPIGAATTALVALTAAAGALNELAEADFESNFGDMELDAEALLNHVNAIGDAFSETYSEVNRYNAALETAVENYTTASSTLSSDLLTKAITGMELTEEDKTRLEGLGSDMGTELTNAIQASFDKSASYLTMLFGGAGKAEYDPEYQDAILLDNTIYNQLIGQAQELGQDFGETLGQAMDDSIITGDEYNTIMEKMQAYNEAMAFAAEADSAAELAQRLHKAQSVSWDSASDFLAEQAEIMNEKLAEAENTHIGERAKQEVYYDKAIQEGWINPTTGQAYTEDDKNKFLADMDKAYSEKISRYKDENAQVTQAVFDSLMSQSDYGEAWKFLSELYQNGDLKRDSMGQVARDAVDWGALFPEGMPEDLPDQLYNLWSGEHGWSGINDKITRILGPYMDSDFIALIPQMLDDALEIMNYIEPHTAETAREEVDMNRGGLNEFFNAIGTGIESNDYSGLSGIWAELDSDSQSFVNYITDNLKNSYDFEKVLADMGGNFADQSNSFRDNMAAYQLMYGNINPEDYRITAQVEPVVTDSSIEEATGEQEIEGTVSISPGGAEAASAYQSEFQSSISSNPPNLSVTTPSGYSDGANYAIGYQAALNANRPRIGVSSGSSTPKGYAEGGRAIVPSIFGEAGPEWAIPEEHSERTAELLNAAREGAGFTWPELIARNGGLNAGSGGGGRTLIYSPTIIASDATGVEEKLLEDKERLNRWYAEKQLRDDLEVYA